MEKFVKEKKIAAMLSILSNTSLIVLKFIAGIISGSIGIISEAIHSASDLLASIITFFSVSESSKPADNDHPYGHGKFEDLGSFIEGILIIFAAFYIIYESLKKIIFLHDTQIDTHLGITVMFISVVANMFVSAYLFKVAKKTDSTALYADGEHLRTDIYSSMAVLVGLICVKMTGNPIFDPIIAIVVAIIIFSAGLKICEKAKESLLDTSLSEASISQIRKIVAEEESIIELKNLKTRNGGLRKNIELTLIVEKSMPISLAHELCDEIEKNIESALKNTDISIHLEPNN